MKILNLFFILSISWLLLSCSPIINNRGNQPNPVLLAQIEPGQQTKDDVRRMLGSPSSQSMFEEESWLYISGKQKQNVFLPPEELERNVIVITFDENGVVKEIKNIVKEEGLDITMSDKETPTSGHSLGVIEQLFGNIGRFEKK